MADKDTETDAEKPETVAEGDVTPLDDEQSAKKTKLKKMLMIGIPVLVLLVLGGLYFTGMFDKLLGKEPAAEHAAAEAEAPAETVAYIDMPDLLVNLSTPPGTSQRYLKLKIKLEAADEKEKAAVEAVLPRITDGFQTFLREMRVEDLRGSAGMYRLRQELLYRVNIAARPAKVKDVLFQEILLQ